jgi:O-methyltransferase involved in polyketide biosynthesis
MLSTRRIRSSGEEAHYWRARAAEVRKVEALFGDADARARLEEIARRYERMASEIESRKASFDLVHSELDV